MENLNSILLTAQKNSDKKSISGIKSVEEPIQSNELLDDEMWNRSLDFYYQSIENKG